MAQSSTLVFPRKKRRKIAALSYRRESVGRSIVGSATRLQLSLAGCKSKADEQKNDDE